MDIKHEAVRILDVMRTTYIHEDVKLRLSLLRGSDDSNPKSAALGFSIKMNLLETAALVAGVAIAVMAIHEYRVSACEQRVKKKLLKEQRYSKKCEKR